MGILAQLLNYSIAKLPMLRTSDYGEVVQMALDTIRITLTPPASPIAS